MKYPRNCRPIVVLGEVHYTDIRLNSAQTSTSEREVLMADPLLGKRIGQYEITSLLGQGGMAVVYRAHQTAMKRDVAMKVVSRLLTQDPNFLERFNREVEFIAGLEHAHI